MITTGILTRRTQQEMTGTFRVARAFREYHCIHYKRTSSKTPSLRRPSTPSRKTADRLFFNRFLVTAKIFVIPCHQLAPLTFQTVNSSILKLGNFFMWINAFETFASSLSYREVSRGTHAFFGTSGTSNVSSLAGSDKPISSSSMLLASSPWPSISF